VSLPLLSKLTEVSYSLSAVSYIGTETFFSAGDSHLGLLTIHSCIINFSFDIIHVDVVVQSSYGQTGVHYMFSWSRLLVHPLPDSLSLILTYILLIKFELNTSSKPNPRDMRLTLFEFSLPKVTKFSLSGKLA
jgi:hypothetical protein